MAIHSSILAWRIPWTEGPGRLQSMGSQRVEHDWVTITISLCPETLLNGLLVLIVSSIFKRLISDIESGKINLVITKTYLNLVEIIYKLDIIQLVV